MRRDGPVDAILDASGPPHLLALRLPGDRRSSAQLRDARCQILAECLTPSSRSLRRALSRSPALALSATRTPAARNLQPSAAIAPAGGLLKPARRCWLGTA